MAALAISRAQFELDRAGIGPNQTAGAAQGPRGHGHVAGHRLQRRPPQDAFVVPVQRLVLQVARRVLRTPPGRNWRRRATAGIPDPRPAAAAIRPPGATRRAPRVSESFREVEPRQGHAGLFLFRAAPGSDVLQQAKTILAVGREFHIAPRFEIHGARQRTERRQLGPRRHLRRNRRNAKLAGAGQLDALPGRPDAKIVDLRLHHHALCRGEQAELRIVVDLRNAVPQRNGGHKRPGRRRPSGPEPPRRGRVAGSAGTTVPRPANSAAAWPRWASAAGSAGAGIRAANSTRRARHWG